ncbi:hypothetical protein [Streptomyces sp. NBC_00316]|uniref:hypothetical protein n=1 Tax=Streptomyces sp. NBC_00316 TaxID=2975710 RepID=UPI002E2918E3|nr:hypothetical protein [Streptomyces sp. NBC_00316]
MIEAHRLTDRYGDSTAVEDLSLAVRPDIVTGSPGPSRTGTSTHHAAVLGLKAPSTALVTVHGRAHAWHQAPRTMSGRRLERAVHTGRTAYRRLSAPAAATGIPMTAGHLRAAHPAAPLRRRVA